MTWWWCRPSPHKPRRLSLAGPMETYGVKSGVPHQHVMGWERELIPGPKSSVSIPSAIAILGIPTGRSPLGADSSDKYNLILVVFGPACPSTSPFVTKGAFPTWPAHMYGGLPPLSFSSGPGIWLVFWLYSWRYWSLVLQCSPHWSDWNQNVGQNSWKGWGYEWGYEWQEEKLHPFLQLQER